MIMSQMSLKPNLDVIDRWLRDGGKQMQMIWHKSALFLSAFWQLDYFSVITTGYAIDSLKPVDIALELDCFAGQILMLILEVLWMCTGHGMLCYWMWLCVMCRLPRWCNIGYKRSSSAVGECICQRLCGSSIECMLTHWQDL